MESEAATVTMVRLARAYDRAGDDDQEAAFRRLATAVAKYWICNRHPVMVAEALECLGGNGYVEESINTAAPTRSRTRATAIQGQGLHASVQG